MESVKGEDLGVRSLFLAFCTFCMGAERKQVNGK